MAFDHFVLPAGLGGVEGHEADQVVGMLGYISGHLLVGDPEAGEPGFAAEDDGAGAAGGSGGVFVPTNGEVDFNVAAGAFGLVFEVFGEVLWVLPEMAMAIDDHEGQDIVYWPFCCEDIGTSSRDQCADQAGGAG